MNKNWRKPLTVYNDCGRSMRFFSNSIPSCTRIISSSLSLYVINTVGLSLIQHPRTANFRPCNVRSWIASCVAGKSDVISFDNGSVKWSFINNTLIWNQKKNTLPFMINTTSNTQDKGPTQQDLIQFIHGFPLFEALDSTFESKFGAGFLFQSMHGRQDAKNY